MRARPWDRLAGLCREGAGAGEADAGLVCGGQLLPGPCGCGPDDRRTGRAGHWTYDAGAGDEAGDVVRMENPMPLFTGWGRALVRCGPSDLCPMPFEPPAAAGRRGGPGTLWMVGLGSFAAALDRAGIGSGGWAGRLCGAGDAVRLVGCVLRHAVRPAPAMAPAVQAVLRAAAGRAVVAAGIRRAAAGKGGQAAVSEGQAADSYAYREHKSPPQLRIQ